MKAKKEILFSLLAVSLAIGLGVVSLGLFGATPPITPSEIVLDVYTQKGGIGSNASGGVFESLDEVPLYAYLTKDGVGVNGTVISFAIKAPDAREIMKAAMTNDSGIASAVLSFLPSEGRVVGVWNVIANTTVDSTSVADELTLQTQTEEALLTLVSKRDGVFSTMFLPNETVFLEAQAAYRNASMYLLAINFTVLTPSTTVFLTEAVPADADGVANVTFQIPWLPSPSSLGIWQATAQAEIYEKSLSTIINFECELLPVTIDVFTQQGGYGQNTPGGTFLLGDAVLIYVQVRDQFNKSVPNLPLIGFEMRGPVNYTRTLQTNTTGIAELSPPHQIPNDPDFVGIYEVYVTADYFNADDTQVRVIDTLTFTVTQP